MQKTNLDMFHKTLSHCLQECTVINQQAVHAAWISLEETELKNQGKMLLFQYLPLIYQVKGDTALMFHLLNFEDSDISSLVQLLAEKYKQTVILAAFVSSCNAIADQGVRAMCMEDLISRHATSYATSGVTYQMMLEEVWTAVLEKEEPELLLSLKNAVKERSSESDDALNTKSKTFNEPVSVRKSASAAPTKWIPLQVILPLKLFVGRKRADVLPQHAKLDSVYHAAESLQEDFLNFVNDVYLRTPRKNVRSSGNYAEGFIAVSLEVPADHLAAFKSEMNGSISDGWGEGAEQEEFWLPELDKNAHFPVSSFKARYVILN